MLENSYFQGINNPVIRDSTATLVQRGNLFSGTSGRNESGGTGTSWDPKSYYGYTLDKAADVPALLKSGAGPSSSLDTSDTIKAAAATLATAGCAWESATTSAP